MWILNYSIHPATQRAQPAEDEIIREFLEEGELELLSGFTTSAIEISPGGRLWENLAV